MLFVRIIYPNRNKTEEGFRKQWSVGRRASVLRDDLTSTNENGFQVATNKPWAKPEPVRTRLIRRTCVSRGPLRKYSVSGRLGQRDDFSQGSAESVGPGKLCMHSSASSWTLVLTEASVKACAIVHKGCQRHRETMTEKRSGNGLFGSQSTGRWHLCLQTWDPRALK